MTRMRVLLGCCIAMLIVVSGCWNGKEMNELAIVVGMAIDKSDDQYQVSIQVVEPEQMAANKATGGRASVTFYRAKAHTISEALREMTADIPRKPYLAHLRILIIGESLAREGIREVLDYLSRYYQFRNDFYIVIAKGEQGGNILTIFTELEKVPANKMFNSLKTSEQEWAPTRSITLDKLIAQLSSTANHPVVTGIEMRGKLQDGQSRQNVENIKSSTVLVYSGLAVFEEDQLRGWLNKEESKGYNYIQGRVQRTVAHATCLGGGRLSFEIHSTKSKIKATTKAGKPHIDIRLRGDASVAEVNCHIDLSKMESIAELEKRLNRNIEEHIEKVISNVQHKYKSDIFGFGESIHRVNPQAWKKLSKDWDRHFEHLPVNVQVDIKIRDSGTLNNSFIEDIKK